MMTLLLTMFDGALWNADSCGTCSVMEVGSTFQRLGPTLHNDARGLTANDYLEIGNSCLEPVTAYTVEAWIRMDVLDTSDRYIAFLGPTVWMLHIDGDAFVVATKGNQSCAAVDAIKSTSKIIVGRWTHVRYTYDGTVQRLFLDGVEEASGGVSETAVCAINTLPIQLGVRSVSPMNALVGAIDEFRYSSVARPPIGSQ